MAGVEAAREGSGVTRPCACDKCLDCLAADRMEAAEAEVARLESELTEWRTSIATEKLIERAEAAEAEVARLRDGLRRMEWIDRGNDYDECAYCEQSEASGHIDTCPLRALLDDGGAA